MSPPAPPPPSGFLHGRSEARGAGMGNGTDPRWDQMSRIRRPVEQALSCIPATADVMAAHVDQALSRIPSTAYVAGAPAPLSHIPTAASPVAPYVPAAAAPLASADSPLPLTRRQRQNRRRNRRRLKKAEQDVPSLTPAPAPGTQDVRAATRYPASSPAAIPASAASVDPLSPVPAATHATATRPTPLYRIPAVPIPAAPHVPAAPSASASPAAPYFSPPRELSKRTAGSAFSAPRKFSQRPAAAEEESDCQIAGHALTGVGSRPMPPPPPPSPLSAAPRAFASPAVDHCSPPREHSQRPAAVATEESISQIAGAVGPAGADRITSVPPRDATVATEESNCQIAGAVSPAGTDRVTSVPPRDATAAREAHVKSVPGQRHATVGQEEESKSAEELKRELERVLKEMNDLRNEFDELKKCMKRKDLEIEAKEAEIQSFKKAKVKDICSARMVDQSFHTPANEALVAEASCWTSTRRAEKLSGKDKELYPSRDGTDTSGGHLEENADLEIKSNKCKDIKANEVQTDTKAALHFRIREVAYYTSPSTTTTSCARPLPFVPTAPHASAAFAAPLPQIPAYIPGAPHPYGTFAAPHSRISAAAATPVPGMRHAYASFASHHFRIPGAAATPGTAYCTSPFTTTNCAPPFPYVPAAPHPSAAFAAPPLPHPRQ